MRTSASMSMMAILAAVGASGCIRFEGGGAAPTGGSAPALEASAWLNTPKAIAWKDLEGKLVLVERWATW